MVLLRVVRRPLTARAWARTSALSCVSSHHRVFSSDVSVSDTKSSNDVIPKLSLAQRMALLTPTLKAFHARHKHFIMHANFTVPTDNEEPNDPTLPPYPREARGLKLGTTLFRLLACASSRRKRADIVDALGAIGCPVHVDWGEYVWAREKLAAFRVYYEIHGHCNIPQRFIVPTDDARWPHETRGFRLGQFTSRLRYGDFGSLTQTQLDELDAFGFRWSKPRAIDPHVLKQPVGRARVDKWETAVLPAFETYYELHGDCHVPHRFTVPNEAPWPQATWGLRLGHIATNMRHTNSYAEYRTRDAERLKTIDFEHAMRSMARQLS